jgi:GNAT superfamily N-acetyltransferase
MRRAGGARAWPGRAYARWAKARPAAAGRLLLGAVAPAWRGQGVGAQLWRQVTAHAVAAGWATISAGPFTADSLWGRIPDRTRRDAGAALHHLHLVRLVVANRTNMAAISNLLISQSL